MITPFMRLAALAALALQSADTGSGGGAASSPTGAPASDTNLDVNPAASPEPQPALPAAGRSEKVAPKAAQVIVWVQPGHQTLQIGQLYRTTPELAEQLRAAGRARMASKAEAKAAKDIPELEGV